MLKRLVLLVLTATALVMPAAHAAHATVCILNQTTACSPQP